MAFQRCYFAVT